MLIYPQCLLLSVKRHMGKKQTYASSLLRVFLCNTTTIQKLQSRLMVTATREFRNHRQNLTSILGKQSWATIGLFHLVTHDLHLGNAGFGASEVPPKKSAKETAAAPMLSPRGGSGVDYQKGQVISEQKREQDVEESPASFATDCAQMNQGSRRPRLGRGFVT